MNDERGDFFVGYLPANRSARRLFKWLLPLCLVVTAALATSIAYFQSTIGVAVHEFGSIEEFDGRIRLEPYPTLRVRRPGRTGLAVVSSYLLVMPFKYGAEDEVRPFAEQHVRLRGTLIYRDDRTMIELEPGSIEAIDSEFESIEYPISGRPEDFVGKQTLRGEIIDSKCFFGVMNPGNRKAHRACATRCIAGGIPPVFLVHGDDGKLDYYLLVDEDGDPVNNRILQMIAIPLVVTGRVEERGDDRFLFANPDTYQFAKDSSD